MKKVVEIMSDSYGSALTDTELESYYQKNKDTLDLFDYNYYLVSAEKVATAAATATDTTSTAAPASTAAATAAPAATAVTDETMPAITAAMAASLFQVSFSLNRTGDRAMIHGEEGYQGGGEVYTQ